MTHMDPASQVLGEQTLKPPKLIPSQAEISAAAVGGEAAVPEIAPTDRSMARRVSDTQELAAAKVPLNFRFWIAACRHRL